VFHEEWERRVFAHTLATLGAGYFKTDEIRRAIEWMPPAAYLEASYYERWLYGLIALLLEKDVLTRDELEAGRSLRKEGARTLPPLSKEQARYAMTHPIPASLDLEIAPRFSAGDRILTRNLHPLHHTRLPRYARGKHGVITHDHGVFPLPDAVAHGGAAQPQHVYSVRFTARELWGMDAPAHDALYLDLFDQYMDPL
ncbi:MAG: nitrile hydratase subunit beta, partial [Gammaproteobacteria bacterium]